MNRAVLVRKDAPRWGQFDREGRFVAQRIADDDERADVALLRRTAAAKMLLGAIRSTVRRRGSLKVIADQHVRHKSRSDDEERLCRQEEDLCESLRDGESEGTLRGVSEPQRCLRRAQIERVHVWEQPLVCL